MYVYRTFGFNDKAERYGIQARIDSLCAELETQRIDEVQARFERIYPYLKRRILNQRLIGRILKIDDEQLLCLLEIFKRGDRNYEEFLNDPIEYGRSHLESQLNESQLRDWLAVAKIEQRPTQQLPELPSTLRPWLEPPGWEIETTTGDWVIYESEEWVRRFSKAEIQNAWETYYQIILKINNGAGELSPRIEDGDGYNSEGERDLISFTEAETQFVTDSPENVKLDGESDRYILYSKLATYDSTVEGVLFLLAPFDHKPSPEEIAEVGHRTGLFDGSNTTNILSQQLNLYELTPFAHRSYPAYLLADEESWLAIERGKEANLALSPEEEQILQSVSSSAVGNNSLPLFINGRAGSGKSTMLIYLFADYCYRKYYTKQGHRRPEPLPGEPLFLTYNERLLEVARDGVKRLLSSHHRFVAERNQGDEIPNIERYFQPFGTFLFSLLPPQERERFNPQNYISFHCFKQLYHGKIPSEALTKIVLHLPQGRRYSPEICWHVIRSFIKGYRQGEFMTPEDYQEDIPRKERTIDLEKFQGIYDTIWERWYKRLTTEEGYWDDQDLIAKVLELDCYCPDYTAIFCDEAQDFTRLELQLIMKLSLFSQYNLGYQPIHSLPFIFAGDPFQTLNPTGFHWSSTQASFDAEVIAAIDPADQLKLAINFQELAFNYRSSRAIVQFTNLIQLWRHVLFDIYELQPQTAWHPGNFPEPQKFILNQNISVEELANYIKDTIIVVPCEEGEELAYAQSDEVLSKIFIQPDSQEDEEMGGGEDGGRGRVLSPIQNLKSLEPIKNILSAIAAKGLEFKRVILYKFGEECNYNVWNLKGKTIDQRVKVEYFFNKLYVAASRATEYLFVVDSEKGERQLWHYASDEALLQAMLGQARSKARWDDRVRTISPGTPKMAQELREDNPDAIAHEFETKGLNSENPGLLRRAKQFYSDLGNNAKAYFCEAWALKFEGQFKEAGNYFSQLGNADEARDCFWQGMCWSELVNWYNLNRNYRTEERSIALFMIADSRNLEAINHFTTFIVSQGFTLATDLATDVTDGFLLQTTNNQQQTTNNQQQWKEAIREYADRIHGLLSNVDITPEQWQQFGEVLVALDAVGYKGLKLLGADCFYRAKNYQQAVSNWEADNVAKRPEYHRAKAKIVGMPDGLEYLVEAGDYDGIIGEWVGAGKPRDRRWLNYVAVALETKHYYQQAFVIYVWLDELVKVKECFELARQSTASIKLITVLFQYFLRKKYWSEGIDAIEKYLIPYIGTNAKKSAVKFEVVYEIACSELRAQEIKKEQRKRVEKFIKEYILSTSEWTQHLLMQQVGITLEKLGVLIETLSFYEQFFDHADPKIRQFARERWIATKQKQEDYAKNQGKFDKAVKAKSELLKQSNSWSISPESVSLVPPAAPKERPRPKIHKSAAQSATQLKLKTIKQPVIQGLPSDSIIEQLEDGVIGFGVRHLRIKVMSSSKQVLIADSLNNREVRVDWAQCQVNIGEATIEVSGGNQLSFAIFASGYSGVLICDRKQSRLELEVQGCVSKISIDL